MLLLGNIDSSNMFLGWDSQRLFNALTKLQSKTPIEDALTGNLFEFLASII